MASDTGSDRRALPVPAHRLSRLARLGGMTAGVAGNMAVGGLSSLSKGNKPVWRDLLMTPQNVSRVADQLAKMRGAAMKVGQLVSMDTGDVLPPELTQILARLRDDAHFMPPAQLKKVLTAEWPSGWLQGFQNFNVRPIAAASIGQVHSATLKDRRKLAIKVQYPGVAASIDSDVANVGALIKMSGLLPRGFDLAPYLEEARKQLHEETDYLREAKYLNKFRGLLADDDRFLVPKHVPEWSTETILAMEFAAGAAIETVVDADQATRDRIATVLIELTLHELFSYRVMQTDPNFANYRYHSETGQIVLLDFGATREIPNKVSEQYKHLMRAGLDSDLEALTDMVVNMGFILQDTPAPFCHEIPNMMMAAFGAFRDSPEYDFGDRRLMQDLQARGMALANDGFIPPPLPVDLLFVQRKLGGVFLLASQLKARVPLKGLLQRYLTGATI